MLGVTSADHVHQPRVFAPHQGVDPQHIVGRAIRGIAAELAKRTFLGIGRRIDRTFQDKLGIGRYADAIKRGLDQFQWGTKQATCHCAFIAAERQTCCCGKHKQRMGADHHGHAQFFTALASGLQHAPQVTARMQAGGEGLPGMAH
ncbi:hypothetical protein D3C80_1600290 [compost metagenome]